MPRFNIARNLRLLLLVVLLAAGAVAVTKTGRAVAAPTPVTAVVLDGSPGDYILGGSTRTFTSTNATFATSANGTDFILNINGNGGGTGEFWTVWLAAPRGTLLAPGTYTGASRAAFRGGTQPGIDVYGDGRGCNQTAGQFVVEEAVYDAGGTTLTSFAATFQQNCEVFGPTLYGEVRYHSSVPYRAIGLTAPTFTDQLVGTSGPAVAATIANTGTDALTLSSVSLQGANAGDFAMSSDGCTGVTLDPGASCNVMVAFTPTSGGYRSAALVISDDTAHGTHTILLSGRGVAPRVYLQTSSLSFGTWEVGVTSTSQTVTLTNVGDASLHVGGLAITGQDSLEFAIVTDTCGQPVAPQQSCSVGLTFTPALPGWRSAALVISDDALDSPQTVPLNGSGIAFADAGISIGVMTPFVRARSLMAYTITVQNFGPDGAYGLTMTDVLPPGLAFLAISTPQGTCTTPATGQTGALVCSLGTLPKGATVNLVLLVIVNAPGRTTVNNTVTLSELSIDPVAANNAATASISVHGRK